MAAHKKSLIVLLAFLTVVTSIPTVVVPGFSPAQAQTHPQRIISIIPSTTEMLFAMGAGPRVIGVGNFDRIRPKR